MKMRQSFYILILISLTLLLGPGSAFAQAPSWFNDFQKSNPECSTQYLCVAGEGLSLAEALRSARVEVSKFFQTKIKASSEVTTTSQQLGVGLDRTSVNEWTSQTLSEEAEEMISGLEIKRQIEMDDHAYVLMALDRSKTALGFREKIKTLDEQNVRSLELNSRLAYPKILRNIMLIEAYLERYNLLSDQNLKLKVTRENIQDKINGLKPLKLSIVSHKKKLPLKFNHLLSEILSPLKFVLVGKKNNPQYLLRSELVAEEQYFKVEGFKKLNIVLRLELLNISAQVLGKISAQSEQVARTSDQAIEKAIPEIKEILLENLDQLSTVKMND